MRRGICIRLGGLSVSQQILRWYSPAAEMRRNLDLKEEEGVT